MGLMTLKEILCLAETFLQSQSSEKQGSKTPEKHERYISELSSEIRQTESVIALEFFCEAMEVISSEMEHYLPKGYEHFENERLCMEFMQIVSGELKTGEIGSLYILSSSKNTDKSTTFSMILSDSLKQDLLAFYDGDQGTSIDAMISTVINSALENFLRDATTKKKRNDQWNTD